MMEILHFLHSKIKALFVIRLFFVLKRLTNYFIIMRKSTVLWVWKCFLKKCVVFVLSFISMAEQPFQTSSHLLQAPAHLAQQTQKGAELATLAFSVVQGEQECSGKEQEPAPFYARDCTGDLQKLLGVRQIEVTNSL